MQEALFKLFINQLTLNFDCNKLFNKKDVSNFIIASKNQIFNRNNALTFFLQKITWNNKFR